MNPYTASNLKEKRQNYLFIYFLLYDTVYLKFKLQYYSKSSYNRIKDYIAVAGKLNVTHILGISQTTKNVILKLCKTPDGPTIHFMINSYSLTHQIKAYQKKPFDSHAAFTTSPLVVLNNFGNSDENHIKLMKATFQHLFPSINIKTVKLTECRRVILFNYNKEEDTVDVRHYAIKAKPTGISRSVKRIIEARVPTLGNLKVY